MEKNTWKRIHGKEYMEKNASTRINGKQQWTSMDFFTHHLAVEDEPKLAKSNLSQFTNPWHDIKD